MRTRLPVFVNLQGSLFVLANLECFKQSTVMEMMLTLMVVVNCNVSCK